MTWLVTGGAGYIGAHVVRSFLEHDVDVVVLDSLASGHREFVPAHVAFGEGSILDTVLVERLLEEHDVTGVVHLAAYKYAGESVSHPIHTYEQNVAGTLSLLRAMAAVGVGNLVFSSSAATYGTPQDELVTEATAVAPESPYGRSKLMGEWLIADQAHATGLRHTSLRYFNVIGSAYDDVYDSSPHNLLPLVFDAISAGHPPQIFGTDYPTPDGTCVRDYIDVGDLARAHVTAAQRLTSGADLAPVYNLGSGQGLSVRQIMDSALQAAKSALQPVERPRRPGDPAQIVASGELAAQDLDWAMTTSVDEMIRAAWRAHQHSVQ